MTEMKHRKKNVLGLLVAAALGLMAFAASAQAIAELGSGFFINGAQVGALKASVTGKQIGRGTLLIPALKLEVNCEKFKILSGFVNTTTDGEGQLLYEECTVLINEKNEKGETISLIEAPGCTLVTSHPGPNQPHITAIALLLPAELNDGTPAVLAEKIEAKVLTKEGTGCVLPKTTIIKGEACFKVVKNHTVEPELESSEAIQKSCNPRLTLEGIEASGTLAEREKIEAEGKGFLDKLLFGINESFVDGKASVALSSEGHKEKTLGVLLI
jgi:hypothetical protein